MNRKADARKRLTLLIGTRKGAFVLHGDAKRREWRITGPHLLGNIINHLVAGPRGSRTMLMAAKTGHLGPTVFRSADRGKSWTEAAQPPAFPKAAEGEEGRAVDCVFWLRPGHESEPGVWYATTSPPGLFRSEDDGVTWRGVDGFNMAMWSRIKGAVFPVPEVGAVAHSILIDPRDARHLYIGVSTGGFFESADRGGTWAPLNKGVAADFLPDPNAEFGHDPHCVILHPLRPDRLYQENHCGVYRIDRPADTWVRIGENMPKSIGDIGFPIVAHPRDPDTAWIVPMDGTKVWPRTAIAGKPAVYATRNAGRSWRRLDNGLPRSQAWFTVKRQAFAADERDPVGLYFGTTSGEIWMSADEGGRWRQIAAHLPHIYSVAAAELE
jgi:hypothetical protein